jgi:hypothetical protein
MLDFRVQRVAGLACMAAVLAFAGPALAQVGVVSVTDGSTSASQGMALQVGQPITTGPDGHVHLMFVDGSAVTAGPNSTLTIRQFSYDPTSKAGTLALDLEQGTMRFVGGAISKTSEVQIATPSSQVGIRGGITAVAVTPDGGTSASFLAGIGMRVSGQGQTEAATRPGSLIGVSSGGTPSTPTVMTSGQFAGFQALDRTPSQRAAVSQSADQALARSGLSQNNSGVDLQRTAATNPHASTLVQGRVQQLQANAANRQIVAQQPVSAQITPSQSVAQQSVPQSQHASVTLVPSLSPPTASQVTTAGSGGVTKNPTGILTLRNSGLLTPTGH